MPIKERVTHFRGWLAFVQLLNGDETVEKFTDQDVLDEYRRQEKTT